MTDLLSHHEGLQAGLTIITASYPPTSQHLPETARSIEELQAVFPETLFWILVIDGPGDIPRFRLPQNTLIIHTPHHCGISVARNIALFRTTTEWAMPLDHDDLIDQAGLVTFWLERQSRTENWFAGNVELVGGGKSPHFSLTPKHFAKRQLESEWTVPFVFYVNAVIFRTELALSIRGWPALFASADLALIFSLNLHYPGMFLPHTIMRYRVWEEQMTQAAGYPEIKFHDFNAIELIINAGRLLDGLSPVTAPDLRSRYSKEGVALYWKTAVDSNKT